MALTKRKNKETVLASNENRLSNIDENTKNQILSINEKIKQICKKVFDNRLTLDKEIIRINKGYMTKIAIKGSYNKLSMKYEIINIFEFNKEFTNYDDIVTELDSIKDKI